MTTSKTKSLIVAFAVLSMLVTAGVLLLYVLTFAGNSNYNLSRTPSDWAQFGDYLSGTLGPAFSLLAFIAVLCTVWLQARQIELTKHQSTLEEIQRVLSSVSERIDNLLAAHCHQNFKNVRLQAVPATFFEVLSGTGTAALTPPSEDPSEHEQLRTLVKLFKDSQSGMASTVVIELDQLAWGVLKYGEEGGTEHVSHFYWRRYNAVAVWLKALGYINSGTYVDHLFKPESQREVFQPLPR